MGSVSAVLQMAPPTLLWQNGQHFGGKIVDLTLLREALEDLRPFDAQDFARALVSD